MLELDMVVTFRLWRLRRVNRALGEETSIAYPFRSQALHH